MILLMPLIPNPNESLRSYDTISIKFSDFFNTEKYVKISFDNRFHYAIFSVQERRSKDKKYYKN